MRSITLDIHRRQDTNFQTELDITNQHIALLASATQLSQLTTGNTLYSHMAALEITADGLTSSVSSLQTNKAGKSEIISVINQSAEALTISGAKLSLNGYTSNPNFKVAIDGSVEVTGKVTASSGKIAGFEIYRHPTDNYEVLRKLSLVNEGTGVSQMQYAVLFGAPDSPVATDNAIRVCERAYSGTGSPSGSWTNNFTVKYNGQVDGNSINITGGSAGGFELGTNFIRKQPVSGTNIYEVSLYAPNSPPSGYTWPTTNAITVRYGTYDSSAASHGRGWIEAFTVKYDGTVSSISPTQSNVTKECKIHNGRFKMYRNSTWIGELAQGTYSTTNANALYIQVGNNVVTGFAVGATSDGAGTPVFLYRPDLQYTYNSQTINGAFLSDRAFYMQEQPIFNAGNITSIGKMTATEFVTSSDRRLKKKIKPIQNSILERVSKVPLRQFEFRKGDGKTHFGAIAQEAADAVNELVSVETGSDGKEGKYYNLNYTEFLILRLAAAEKRIEALERSISNHE